MAKKMPNGFMDGFFSKVNQKVILGIRPTPDAGRRTSDARPDIAI